MNMWASGVGRLLRVEVVGTDASHLGSAGPWHVRGSPLAACVLHLRWEHEPPLPPPGHPGRPGGPDPHRRPRRRAEGLTMAAVPLLRALTQVRGLLLDDQALVR